MAENPPTPRPSATILLVRDGEADLEVFMVERHHQIDFATGALVFPGGKVDDADADPKLVGRCDGIEGLDETRRALFETFEEAGVLLARPRGSRELLSAETLRGVESRHRQALNEGQGSMLELVEEEDLQLACDLLLPFAHWITPTFMPKRFDTHFFLVAAPADHLAIHDGGESVDSLWISPAAAAAECEAGRRTIIFPTLMNVRKLGRSRSVEAALAAARRDPIVTVQPHVEKRDGVATLVLPEDAGYDVVTAPLSGIS
jgi:8-oxo-dGTP pyrophosphatase MutT (NUDIX family)